MTDTMHFGFDAVATGTNINDIKVDPRLEQRASSGLDFVDLVASGPDAPAGKRGFVPSSVVFFTGGPGAGKSTLSLQMADAMTGVGHSVLFIGGEESAAQTRITYKRLGLKNGFTIANPYFTDVPQKVTADVVKAVGDNTVRHHLDALLVRYKAAQASRISSDAKNCHPVVIIDSLQALNDGMHGLATNSKTSVRVLNELCEWAKMSFAIVIVIGHVGKGGEFKGENIIKHMVDAHLELMIDTDDKSDTCGFRLLEMSKHRFGPTGLTTVLDLSRGGFRERNAKKVK